MHAVYLTNEIHHGMKLCLSQICKEYLPCPKLLQIIIDCILEQIQEAGGQWRIPYLDVQSEQMQDPFPMVYWIFA